MHCFLFFNGSKDSKYVESRVVFAASLLDVPKTVTQNWINGVRVW
jgi:hypothetical protein